MVPAPVLPAVVVVERMMVVVVALVPICSVFAKSPATVRKESIIVQRSIRGAAVWFKLGEKI